MKKIKRLALTLLPLLMLASCGEPANPTTTSDTTPTTESTVATEYSITVKTGAGYEVTDLSATTAAYGTTITFKVKVTDPNKVITKVTYNATELTADESGVYSFRMPRRNVEIEVVLREKAKEYTVTAATGEGYTITDLSHTSCVAGTEVSFKVNLTNAESSIKEVKANNVKCTMKGEAYVFTMPEENVTITVTLASSYAITANDGADYTISDLSATSAYEGKTVTFKVTCTNSLKKIDTVKANTVDCTSIGGGVYSFTMPGEAVTIAVTTTAVSFGLDLTDVQTGYIVNELVPSQSDVFDPTGLKCYVPDASGNPVELTPAQYETVTFSSPDVEDLSKPLPSTGVKKIVVTFGEETAEFEIAVGTYTLRDVRLVPEDINVKLSVLGQYTGVSLAQFKAFNWGFDFQHNDNVDHQGWGTVIDTDNEGTEIDFSFDEEENLFGMSIAITSLPNGAYTTHFGHKLVGNGNGDSKQKMDLLLPGGKAQRLVLGDKAYMVQFGAFWGKGDVDITVADATDPYDKVKREITNVELFKSDEDKPIFRLTGSFEAFFENDEITEADIKCKLDACQYDVWGEVRLEDYYVIDFETKTFTVSVDISTFMNTEGPNYFFHFGAGNLGFKNLVATTVELASGAKYQMGYGKDLGCSGSWANDLVTLKYTAPEDPTAFSMELTGAALSANTENKLVLTLSGTGKNMTSDKLEELKDTFKIDFQHNEQAGDAAGWATDLNTTYTPTVSGNNWSYALVIDDIAPLAERTTESHITVHFYYPGGANNGDITTTKLTTFSDAVVTSAKYQANLYSYTGWGGNLMTLHLIPNEN